MAELKVMDNFLQREWTAQRCSCKFNNSKRLWLNSKHNFKLLSKQSNNDWRIKQFGLNKDKQLKLNLKLLIKS